MKKTSKYINYFDTIKNLYMNQDPYTDPLVNHVFKQHALEGRIGGKLSPEEPEEIKEKEEREKFLKETSQKAEHLIYDKDIDRNAVDTLLYRPQQTLNMLKSVNEILNNVTIANNNELVEKYAKNEYTLYDTLQTCLKKSETKIEKNITIYLQDTAWMPALEGIARHENSAFLSFNNFLIGNIHPNTPYVSEGHSTHSSTLQIKIPKGTNAFVVDPTTGLICIGGESVLIDMTEFNPMSKQFTLKIISKNDENLKNITKRQEEINTALQENVPSFVNVTTNLFDVDLFGKNADLYTRGVSIINMIKNLNFSTFAPLSHKYKDFLISSLIFEYQNVDAFIQLTTERPIYWEKETVYEGALSYYDPFKGNIKIYGGIDLSNQDGELALLEGIAQYVDRQILNHKIGENIEKVSTSGEFYKLYLSEIQNPEIDPSNKFKNILTKKTPLSAEEFFISLFAAMYSGNQTIIDFCKKTAPQASQFIHNLVDQLATESYAFESSIEAWTNFKEKYSKITKITNVIEMTGAVPDPPPKEEDTPNENSNMSSELRSHRTIDIVNMIQETSSSPYAPGAKTIVSPGVYLQASENNIYMYNDKSITIEISKSGKIISAKGATNLLGYFQLGYPHLNPWNMLGDLDLQDIIATNFESLKAESCMNKFIAIDTKKNSPMPRNVMTAALKNRLLLFTSFEKKVANKNYQKHIIDASDGLFYSDVKEDRNISIMRFRDYYVNTSRFGREKVERKNWDADLLFSIGKIIYNDLLSNSDQMDVNRVLIDALDIESYLKAQSIEITSNLRKIISTPSTKYPFIFGLLISHSYSRNKNAETILEKNFPQTTQLLRTLITNLSKKL
ncbi:hypothetical protein [Bacillus cereus]|uniref:hypothetical protein n=1 Tax=Bacillus cereus TaxID=1396 RepID=UPI0040414804